MEEKQLGKCGFYCGVCPTYRNGSCAGCLDAHQAGDCATRDCVLKQGIPVCTMCHRFPCDTILETPRCTVLDKDWLQWKKSETGIPYGETAAVNIQAYWSAVLRQDADAIRAYFHPTAFVNWHNTNEHFTVEEFIRANCAYPGDWGGKVEQTITTPTHIMTATHVYSKDGTRSFHVASLVRVADGKIASIDEYWGDDGDAPMWRQALHLGTTIQGGQTP